MKVSLLIVSLLAILSAVHSQLKDVLFITVDDLRAELGAYGHSEVKTPNIDALAAKSLVFERAYCQVAVCSPSRTSLLTGRRPDTNHVWLISPNEYWRTFTNATTIPQYFMENEYLSIGMGKIFHPGPPSDFDDHKYSWSLPYYSGFDQVSANGSWHSFVNITDNMLADGIIAQRAITYLKVIGHNRIGGNNTSFFMAVGFHKPHPPFYAPSKYYDLYPPAEQIKPPANPDAPKDMPPIAWSTSLEMQQYSDFKKYHTGKCFKDVDDAMFGESCKVDGLEAQRLRRAYYAAVSYADAQVGRVIDELEIQGLANNTIIVLLGDHGFKLGEHKMWAKSTNMEDDARVPFMIRVPGVTDSGMRTKALVELIDIFPSITELAGLQVPPLCPENNKDLLTCVEGTSVVPLLKETDKQWKKAAFSQFARPDSTGFNKIPGRPDFGSKKEAVMGYTIRTDKYRFVEWYTFNSTSATPNFTDIWGTELYDHTVEHEFFNDENTNIAGDPNMQSLVQEMRQMLHAGWRAAVPSNNKPNSESSVTATTEATTECCAPTTKGGQRKNTGNFYYLISLFILVCSLFIV